MSMQQSLRQRQKEASRQSILEVASQRLREGGPGKVGIATVMKEAGLTHGGFYAHFPNKDALTVAAFRYAIDTNQPGWFANADRAASFDERLAILAETYLTPRHRDHPGSGCAIAALAPELGEASGALKAGYGAAVKQTIETISEGDSELWDEAAVFLSTITGAINLARNTADKTDSNRILRATVARFAH